MRSPEIFISFHDVNDQGSTIEIEQRMSDFQLNNPDQFAALEELSKDQQQLMLDQDQDQSQGQGQGLQCSRVASQGPLLSQESQGPAVRLPIENMARQSPGEDLLNIPDLDALLTGAQQDGSYVSFGEIVMGDEILELLEIQDQDK